MDVVFKQLFLHFLLVCVSLVDAWGVVDTANGYFRRKDVADYGKLAIQNIQGRMRRSNYRRIEANTIQGQRTQKLPDKVITVTAQAGSSAFLHCDTGTLGIPGKENITVLWIRWYDESRYLVLTNNEKVVTDDKRFSAANKTNYKDWSLHIRYTQTADEGRYQCHACSSLVSSNRSIYIELKLKVAHAIIIGGPIKEVDKPGTPLRLSCVLNNSIEAPAYIFWYRGDRMINYDLGDGATVRDGRQGSELIFPMAQIRHAGNYSCVPSNAIQASVEVIFLNSETSGTKNGNKNSGKTSYPQDHIVNMLVLVSAFRLYR